MQIGKQIGNKLDWKHKKDWKQSFQIGNKKGHWKQSFQIGNKMLRLETQKLDWKQNKYIGNNRFTITQCDQNFRHGF